jgi:heme exporter protein D
LRDILEDLDMKEFLDMGGYAAFVWPAFLITAVVLTANLVAARRREDAVLADLRRRRAAERRAA